MKKMLFLCNRYPCALTPTRHVFVQKLVWAMADMGIDCTVISPVPVNQYLRSFFKQPREVIETTPTGNKVVVYFPRYFTFGQRKIIGFPTSLLTVKSYHAVVKNAIKKYKINFSVVYGHFLVPAGITAARIGREFGVPSYAAYGEASPRDQILYGLKRIRREVGSLDGIISVSSENKRILENMKVLDPYRIKVFPNAIQEEHFYPRNKKESRRKIGIPDNSFHVVFVGQFNNRKGVLRVAEAVRSLEGVTVAFAGKGDLSPVCENLVFSGTVLPEDMPYFLSAADVFVMPTLNEGCSNAIVEAMACGLPIISSKLPFNEDILGDDNAILINPINVLEIRNAILHIKNNPDVALKMSKATIFRAKKLSINERASRIFSWLSKI